MKQAILFIALACGLAGCKYLPQDADQSCDKLVDWNDRKACKAKQSTEQKEWEKRNSK
ncbi:MAG TPA: hypothetical protein VF774_19905 [Pseudoduganella sp.]